jgi:small subunit ribosomal protein S17
MTKILTGKVVATKMDKTIVVKIVRHQLHPLYKKIVKRSKRYKAESGDNQDIKIGDVVKIVETRPVSRQKHFKLVK